MPDNDSKLKTFVVWSDKIEGRIDPFFYDPEIVQLLEKLKKKKTYKLGGLIADISGGATPRVTEDFYLESGGIPFLRVQNITEEGIKLDDVKFIKPEVHKNQLKRSQLKAGDVVFTITGRIGSVAVVPDDFVGNINQHSVRFHLKEKIDGVEILPEYIAVYFNTGIGRALSLRNITGGTRPALDYEALRNLDVPLPPLAVQQKVIEKVKKVYEEKRKKEEEIKKILASIDDFVLGELGIEIPEGGAEQVYEIWSDEILGGRLDPEYYNPRFKLFYAALSKAKYNIVNLEQITKTVFQGVGKNETENPAITLLKVKNITRNGEIDYSDIEFVQDVPEAKLLQKGDIVSPFIGEAVRQCKFAIFDRDDAAFAVDNNTGVIRVDTEKANSRYVAEVLNSSVGRIQLEQLIGGGGVPFLGAANAAKLQIPLPPIKTQERIADKIISFREQVRTLRAQATEVLESAQKQVEQMILA